MALKFGKSGVDDAEAMKTVADNEAPRGIEISPTADVQTGEVKNGVVGSRDDDSPDKMVATGAAAQEAIQQHIEAHHVERPGRLFHSSTHTLKIGRWLFKDSQLRIADADDAEEFVELLKKQPPTIRAQVRELDALQAESLIRSRARQGMFSGVDTTANTTGPTGEAFTLGKGNVGGNDYETSGTK